MPAPTTTTPDTIPSSTFSMPTSTGRAADQYPKGIDKAITTRYFDCCKPAYAAYPGATSGNWVNACAKDGTTPFSNSQSGCGTGSSFACSYSPIVIDDSLSLGFAAHNEKYNGNGNTRCQCYKLDFQPSPLSGNKLEGKSMIVQVTNTGVEDGHFDIEMPEVFEAGCQAQYGTNAPWGTIKGDLKTVGDCDYLPPSLKNICLWRFGWFENANNPNVLSVPVKCPKALTNLSGCLDQ